MGLSPRHIDCITLSEFHAITTAFVRSKTGEDAPPDGPTEAEFLAAVAESLPR